MKKLLHQLAVCPHLQRNLQPHQFADFCRQLKESDEVLEAQDASELLDLFCLFYWRLNNLQKSCFEDVNSVWLNASRPAWIKIIPRLIQESSVCNDFVFLAKILIKELSAEECKKLDKMYLPAWTEDSDYTSITKEEYAYRQANGLKCWIYEYPPMPNGKVTIDYRRPCCIHDLKCFYVMLEVLSVSGQKVYFFMGGYSDSD